MRVVAFRVASLISLLFAGLATASAAGLDVPMPCDATLRLDLAPGATGSVQGGDANVAGTARIVSVKPGAFGVLVTPSCVRDQRLKTGTHEELRTLVESMAQEAKPSAVEDALPAIEIEGPGIRGYYFSATDKAPKPGEFRYMSQGTANVGGLQIVFTVLSNGDRAAVEPALLEMIRSVRLVPLPTASE